MKSLNKRYNTLQVDLIKAICSIEEVPEGLLPHTVFVEEENAKGEPAYAKYALVKINAATERCVIKNEDGSFEEEISLSAVNTDWLLTVWNYYLDLSMQNKKKGIYAFLYPAERFERNASDADIISDWENDERQDPCTIRLTVDEYAAGHNDNPSDNSKYYIRFIYY